MYTFEITIQRRVGENWPVVVEQSTSGVFLPVRAEGILSLDLVALRSQITPKDYGTLLGQTLFRDEVRDAFVRARAESDDLLRLLLCIEDAELKMLRWERLCVPLDGRWDFLALDQRVPFSLYLPSLTDRRFPPIGRRDLRALVLVASPEGLEQYRLEAFDVQTAVSSVRTVLGGIPCTVLAPVAEAVGLPTLDALCERITAESYTLLHMVCHGQFQREAGETILYLATADNRVESVSGTRLLERLSRLRGTRGLPHFAFLATCESARAEAEGALGGLAQRLVRELGMPAVVAMTEKVSVTTAQALTEAFYDRLQEHGEVDRALVEAGAGLAERYDITVPALYSRLGGRPLFSDTLDRPLTNAEIAFGLDRLEQLLAERAPGLQPAFETPAARLRGTLGTEVAALSIAAREEREHALVEVNKLCGEALDLSFNALALEQNPPAYDSRCPFRGLYPFRVEDQEFFFGREALIEHLRQKLNGHNFLAVLGPSGSGKSSLVLAGLLPALLTREPGLQTVSLTPGRDPVAQLEASLSKVPHQPVMLVVDQFEELFTLCTDNSKRQLFLDRLLLLVAQMRVVLTMRADFWGECAPYRDLKTSMQAHQELIAPMDTAELRRAMEMQAAKVGLRFEADLSHTLLEDVQGEPGAMPLLQHALLELWKRRHGRWLRVQEYREKIGGVQQAIGRTAADVYKQLSLEEQHRVRDIFVRLTRLDEDAVQGEERRDTRRRVGMEELVPAGSDPALTRALVQRLADARLVVTSRNAATSREEVEVAHEALIRYWAELRSWLDEDRTSLRLRETIRQAAQAWEGGGREDSLLVHRGSRLEEAQALSRQTRFALNELEQTYVDACVALRESEKERQRRMARFRWGAFAAIAILIIAALGIGLRSAQRDAENTAAFAASQLKIAQQQQEAAKQAQDFAEKQQRLAAAEVQARTEADTRRAEAERLLKDSIAQSLVDRVLRQQDQRQDERNALLARQAYLFSQQGQGHALIEADNALRTVLSAPYFSSVLHRSRYRVSSVAFSPDSKTLALGSHDYTVRLWDLTTPGATPKVLQGPQRHISSVAFSPDGKTLASGSENGTVCLWDMANPGAKPKVLQDQGPQRQVWSVAFSPDGKALASGHGNTVQLWDLISSGAEPKVLHSHQKEVTSVAFSRDGKLLASGSTDNTVQLQDLANPGTASKVLQVESGHGGGWGVWSVAFSPDGQTLAAGRGDNTVRLWDLTNLGTAPKVLPGHYNRVTSVAFSPDGQTLASGSQDGTVRLWDLTTPGADPKVLQGHMDDVTSVAFSPDGQTLASGSRNGTMRLWHLPTPSFEPRALPGHADVVCSVAFSPDGQTLASASLDSTVRLWDLTKPGSKSTDLVGHDNGVRSVAFSPDSKTLASGSDDNTVRLWDLTNLRAEPKILEGHGNGHGNGVLSVAFSPGGKTLAAGSRDTTVCLWDLTNPGTEPQILPGHRGEVSSVAFSPDGQTLASASGSLDVANLDNTVRLWDLTHPSAEPIILRGHERKVRSVAFSSDRKTLASGSYRTVRLWDLTNPGAEPKVLQDPQNEVTSVAFSRDGKLLASGSIEGTLGSTDGIVLLWVTNPRAEPKVLQGHKKGVSSVAFSPDGQTLASASSDGTIRLWSTPEALANMVCQKVWRNLTLDEWHQFVGVDIPYERTCSNLPFHGLLEQGKQLVTQGQGKAALAAYAEAQRMDRTLEIAAESWGYLCWFGSRWRVAADVMPACEQAVALAPGNGNFRNGRGLARALTGDVDGAIADFQAFIAWTQNEEFAAQRQRWIEALHAGKNPFTAEEFEKLRYQ